MGASLMHTFQVKYRLSWDVRPVNGSVPHLLSLSLRLMSQPCERAGGFVGMVGRHKQKKIYGSGLNATPLLAGCG